MGNRDMVIHDYEFKLDGTIAQLLDQANRYTDDFTDEQLTRLSKICKQFGLDEADIRLPLFLIDERKRECAEDDTMPYERMKIDHYLLGNVSYHETKRDPQMEIEIREERGNVLICANGCDDEGFYTAANVVSIDEFMNGDYDFLEHVFAETLFYGKMYEETEEAM